MIAFGQAEVLNFSLCEKTEDRNKICNTEVVTNWRCLWLAYSVVNVLPYQSFWKPSLPSSLRRAKRPSKMETVFRVNYTALR